MRKTIKVACAFGLIALLTGCSTTKVGVSARKAPLDAYQAGAGHLNTPQYALGDLVAMSPTTKSAWRVMSIPVHASETRYGRPADGQTESFKGSFELAFDHKLPTVAREQVEDAVRSDTDLHVEKTWDRSIRNPATFALAHREMLKKMEQARKDDPQVRFFLVTRVTAAEKVYLTFGESSKDAMALNQYQFTFKFDQNENLAKLSRNSAAFFTATPVALAQDQNGQTVAAIDSSFGENLPQYTFAETGQAW